MLLLIGPPGSGKTTFCMDRMRQSLASGDPGTRLLLPTTTLAEHLRNQLAREGFVFSPGRVSTFGKYLNGLCRDLPPVIGSAALEILCAELLPKLPLERYASVRDFPGFRAAVVRAIQDFSGAGGRLSDLLAAGVEPDFHLLLESVGAELVRRGQCLRGERSAALAARIAAGSSHGVLYITGFFNFTPPEIEILRRLAEKSDLTVTLPDNADAVAALRTFASEVRVLEPRSHTAVGTLVPAPTQDAEAVEIARRILELRAAGRLFREMGVVVRSEQPLVPALRNAFDRFGIPARFYFAAPLGADPVVLYLSAIVDAALSGWDFAKTLRAVRLHGSPIERTGWGDRFEHEVLGRLPAQGLDALRALAPERGRWYFDELAKLDAWRSTPAPASLWRERFLQLPALFRPAAIGDRVSHETVLAWRSHSMAIEHFNACVVEAAATFDPAASIPCSEFWAAVRLVIDSDSVHLVDRRRDVVHVIDVFEARQWRLPVIFLAGLLEGEFPKYPSEDPILPDPVRSRLKARGVALRTTHDRRREEILLFDTVLARATEALYLSYARLNSKGEPNLPSFFLERVRPLDTAAAQPVRPRPSRPRAPEPHPVIYREDLREIFAARHAVLSASAVEAYVQCPFHLFATRALHLAEPPVDPHDRLSILVQGNIAHRTFERFYRDHMTLADAFDRSFAEFCASERVPDSYRTEAVRLELFHAIEQLAAADVLPHWHRSFFELSFEVDAQGLKMRGKIDRLEVDEHGNAFVIDYKYQIPSKITETVRAHEDGKKVQGGIYLLAAEQMGYQPAGMIYCGFKQGVKVDGWVRDGLLPHLAIRSSPEAVAELSANARAVALQVMQDIRNGKIAPEPEDDSHCARCTYLKICRVDASPARVTAGGAR